MAIEIYKPGFNLREKLNEVDYANIPYEKMPIGSCIGVQAFTNRLNIGSLTVDFNGSQDYIAAPAFTYYKKHPDSLLYIEYRWAFRGWSGYLRESIYFDHNKEDAFTENTLTTQASPLGGYGGGAQNASSPNWDANIINNAYGVLGGYVHGPSNGGSMSTSSYYFVNRSLSGFVRYPSNYCSFALALASENSGNDIQLREDQYAATRAIVMEFKQ